MWENFPSTNFRFVGIAVGAYNSNFLAWIDEILVSLDVSTGYRTFGLPCCIIDFEYDLIGRQES
jgi:hypothetical protein